jgi:hypothetical protein
LGLPLNFALWTWDFSHDLSLWAAFFLTFGVMTGIRLCSQHWPCFPSFPHPIPHSLSLSQLPFPSSGIWAAFLGPPILKSATPSLAHREVPLPQHACNCHQPLANILPSVSPLLMQSCDHSLLFPQNPSTRLQLTLSLHISLSLFSLLRTWYFGDAHHISPQVRPHHRS